MTTDINNPKRDYATGAESLKAFLVLRHSLQSNRPLHAVATHSDKYGNRWMAFAPREDGSCEVIEAVFVITPSRGYWVRREVKTLAATDARAEWSFAATHGEWHGSV